MLAPMRPTSDFLLAGALLLPAAKVRWNTMWRLAIILSSLLLLLVRFSGAIYFSCYCLPVVGIPAISELFAIHFAYLYVGMLNAAPVRMISDSANFDPACFFFAFRQSIVCLAKRHFVGELLVVAQTSCRPAETPESRHAHAVPACGCRAQGPCGCCVGSCSVGRGHRARVRVCACA